MDRELTKLELKLMNILWAKKKAFVSEIIDVFSTPKPANSTISTMMRILVNKGFVSFKVFGKSNCYYPLISREEYIRSFICHIKDSMFGGSVKSMMSFFAENADLSFKEIDELIGILDQRKTQKG